MLYVNVHMFELGYVSIILIAIIRAIIFSFDILLVLRSPILPLDFLIILFLPNHIILQSIPLLSCIIKGGLFCQIIQICEKAIEIFVYLFFLVLDLLVLGLTLPATELGALFVLEEVDQLPPALEVYLVLVVTHSS